MENQIQNIIFDDGLKSFMVQNDPSRVIKFSPTDYGLIERIDTAGKKMQEAVKQLGEDIELKTNGEPMNDMGTVAEVIREVNKIIFEQVDYIFNAKVSEIVFGNQSPMSTVKGNFLFENFMNAVTPYLVSELEVEQKASNARIKKYTNQVKKGKK